LNSLILAYDMKNISSCDRGLIEVFSTVGHHKVTETPLVLFRIDSFINCVS
jgi:hypothetical protein